LVETTHPFTHPLVREGVLPEGIKVRLSGQPKAKGTDTPKCNNFLIFLAPVL
jgi:hypothetical protein